MKTLRTLYYLGPNRRSDSTCLEQHYVLDEGEEQAFADALPGLKQALEARLAGLGIESDLPELSPDDSGEIRGVFAQLICGLALALQQAGGHRVYEWGYVLDDVDGGVWAWFEYEHHELDVPAAELSMRLIAETVPGIVLHPSESAEPTEFAEMELDEAIGRYLEKARPLVLPLVTEAMIKAARRLNIPVKKLERLPFEGAGGDIRILKNGLLMLGDGPHQQEVDGTLATWRSGHLLNVIEQRRSQQQPTAGATAPGTKHLVLVAGGKVLGLVVDGVEKPVSDIHQETHGAAERLAQNANTGLLVLEIMTGDISQPLAQTGGVVSDIHLAPELDQMLPPGSDLMDKACEAFLRWLFPDDDKIRIPIVAVTGTNGKTTTCRMIVHIARTAGKNPALSCTEGVYINSEHIGRYGDLGGGAFHHLLTRDDVDFAVCEEWLGRICRMGFAYQNSAVAVCTNVTNDHLGRVGLHTMDDLARMKEAVPERGREAVVLNAENEYTLAMAPRMKAGKVCLVSTRGRSGIPGPDDTPHNCTCTVENREGRDWIVINDEDQDISVVAVDDIPATFNGVATHNVSNALHAVAASYFAKLPLDSIREGLQTFVMSFETTPGRLNMVDELPYRVVMDYAHNHDGYEQILAFMAQLECEGQRRLLLAYTGDRIEEDVLEGARIMAGHFDHYVCRNYLKGRGQAPELIPRLLHQGLRKAGVSEDAITVIEDSQEAVDFILDSAQAGDLVLLLPGTSEFELIWENIQARIRKHKESG